MTTPTPKLNSLAAAGNYDALEEKWLEACESPPPDPTPFVEAARTVRDKGDLDHASTLLSLVLPSYGPGSDPQGRLALLELAAECDPSDVGTRRQLVEAVGEAYADSPGIKAFMRAADIDNSPNPAQAVQLMRQMMRFDVGSYVYHAAGWGAGTVRRISAATGKMTVDFENNKGHSMPLSGAPSILEVIEPDDFRAMCFAQPDEVKRLSQEDPATLFESLLKVRKGKATTKQVKLDLQDRVISKAVWSKWWPMAKKALRDAPMIEMTGGSSPDFILRDKPITADEELAQRFASASRPELKLDAAREFLDRPEALKAAPDLAETMASGLLVSATKWQQTEPSRWLETLLVVAELRRRTGDADMPENMRPSDVIAASDDVVALLRGMHEDDLRREAMETVRQTWPEEWPAVWARLATTPSPAVCDYIMRELDSCAQPEYIREALDSVREKPEANPDSMMWLWKRAMAHKLPIQLDVAYRIGLFEKMLRLLNTLSDMENRPATSKVRSCLSASNFDPVESLAKEAPSEEARRLHDMVRFNKGLTENAKMMMLNIFEGAHPKHFRVELKPWEEAITYTTEAALDKPRAELFRLTEVEYPKIAKAIGDAAERGDISDNAEFQTAIEARTQLTQKAATLKDQIDAAKVITGAIVPAKEIGIGSKVTVKNLADESTMTFSLLGPWDAAPDRDILSYRAPFSQAFLGKKQGDTVEVESAGQTLRYRVEALASAI